MIGGRFSNLLISAELCEVLFNNTSKNIIGHGKMICITQVVNFKVIFSLLFF